MGSSGPAGLASYKHARRVSTRVVRVVVVIVCVFSRVIWPWDWPFVASIRVSLLSLIFMYIWFVVFVVVAKVMAVE